MNTIFAKTQLGDFIYKKIYAFNDEPLLFSCDSEIGNIYLILRQSDKEPKWLAMKVKKERLKKLENNEIDTYTAFTKPEYGCLYLLIGDPKSIEMKLILPEQLSDEMLPYPGEFLDYHSDDTE